MTTYAIVIEQRGSCFRAYVPDLPGCTATGNSLAEAEAAVREVLRNLPPAGAAFAAQANQALRSGGYAWVRAERSLSGAGTDGCLCRHRHGGRHIHGCRCRHRYWHWHQATPDRPSLCPPNTSSQYRSLTANRQVSSHCTAAGIRA